ncbi:sugar phosphate isomerase/epimerase [Robiginitalea sp. SC105]|uniref:sugar phosphate isomerase/epimerase family protein n=1 Tax=Robiginitalea sp. SC105 TaxID=2762332 RepID=UPI001639AC53|nr:sugar phosphate isomerase/epimerase [Robiginitalea sp. SC105]MBC2838589.1 sugar phosphate isomerase/epimerase [Robiginitalea sp. SC105]
MSIHSRSRRNALKTGLTASLGLASGMAFSMEDDQPKGRRATQKHELPFRVSLNTSTLMAYELPVDQQIDLIAGAGFDGTELWMRDIRAYLEKGGARADLKEKLEAGNLVLENIIGFSQWCNDDPEERKKALEVLQGEMEIIADLGGGYIATPVMGVEKLDPLKFDEYAQRYRAILELGDETGVYPLLELWGMGALHRVSDCAQITIGSGHPKAAVLLDIYHVHRGGNTWDTVDVLNGARLPVIHMNDYPATPAWNELTDGDRVLPGEGVCPFDTVIPKLYAAGFRGGFSVELFNQGYWSRWDAREMLERSYASTVAVLTGAMKG